MHCLLSCPFVLDKVPGRKSDFNVVECKDRFCTRKPLLPMPSHFVGFHAFLYRIMWANLAKDLLLFSLYNLIKFWT